MMLLSLSDLNAHVFLILTYIPKLMSLSYKRTSHPYNVRKFYGFRAGCFLASFFLLHLRITFILLIGNAIDWEYVYICFQCANFTLNVRD